MPKSTQTRMANRQSPVPYILWKDVGLAIIFDMPFLHLLSFLFFVPAWSQGGLSVSPLTSTSTSTLYVDVLASCRRLRSLLTSELLRRRLSSLSTSELSFRRSRRRLNDVEVWYNRLPIGPESIVLTPVAFLLLLDTNLLRQASFIYSLLTGTRLY